ncbi:hypothetical protein GGR52DRAFT_522200 [Hypoxylon sp. FL1284]|nr:hypothetical protein GGR52DRAFT_522200 [Hypoxylon sp. FL1284]
MFISCILSTCLGQAQLSGLEERNVHRYDLDPCMPLDETQLWPANYIGGRYQSMFGIHARVNPGLTSNNLVETGRGNPARLLTPPSNFLFRCCHTYLSTGTYTSACLTTDHVYSMVIIL